MYEPILYVTNLINSKVVDKYKIKSRIRHEISLCEKMMELRVNNLKNIVNENSIMHELNKQSIKDITKLINQLKDLLNKVDSEYGHNKRAIKYE